MGMGFEAWATHPSKPSLSTPPGPWYYPQRGTLLKNTSGLSSFFLVSFIHSFSIWSHFSSMVVCCFTGILQSILCQFLTASMQTCKLYKKGVCCNCCIKLGQFVTFPIVSRSLLWVLSPICCWKISHIFLQIEGNMRKSSEREASRKVTVFQHSKF